MIVRKPVLKHVNMMDIYVRMIMFVKYRPVVLIKYGQVIIMVVN